MSDAVDMMDYYPLDNPINEHSIFWTTKDGREILISSMSNEHLLNAFLKFNDKRLAREITIRLFTKEVIK